MTCLLLLLIVAAAASAAQPPDFERRIDALLAKMTLEEKLGQMSQSTSMHSPLSGEIKDQIRRGRWGSFLNAGEFADRAEAQRIALKESRLGIPLIFGRDVIHGYRTVFPIPLGQAASWDPELIEEAARVAGREAAAVYINWTFAPMLDIARDPRWGRIAESLGEDPYLGSALGAAMVRGFQSSIAACAKHFAGYGAAEGGRDYNTTWVPELLLRNVYLRPFHAARDAGVASFMTAFNDLNGIPATGNAFLLREVLRKEWGFDGFVVSDYNAVTELIPHGYAAGAADAAFKALRAGVDMEMVSTSYYDTLKSGKADPKWIDAAVRNILRVKFRLGLFDKPVAAAAETAALLTPAALRTAKKLAEESVVLLKNEHALPLSKSIGKLAVMGPLADSPVDQMGTWVMDGRPQDVRTPLAALRDMLGASRVVNDARAADAVVLFLGEPAAFSGEARSRAFLDLPSGQEALATQAAQAGKPLIVVIMAGRPLTFHSVAEKAAAVLYAWHPGTMGGPAIADLLFGNAVPSGKLTATFPRTVGQAPIYYEHMNTGRPPSPKELGIPIGNPVKPTGFTSKYIDVDYTPEYPFGFGLSYTTFEYSNLRLSSPVFTERLTVSADVANTGRYEADEIVQLYTRQLVGSVTRPVRELKGFRRIHLKPGEKQSVAFTLSRGGLAFYNEQMRLVTEPGQFYVWIAPDSARGLQGEFRVE